MFSDLDVSSTVLLTRPAIEGTLAESMRVGRRGRQEAGELSVIVSQEQQFLRQTALRLCRNAAEANDLVQDTCERALTQAPGEIDNPRAWLTRIMHNRFIDRCRQQARRPSHEVFEEGTIPIVDHPQPEPAWLSLTLADVVAALPEINEPLRRTYELHTFQKYSYAEIAAILGIKTQTVGTQLFRARRQLREVLIRRHGVGR